MATHGTEREQWRHQAYIQTEIMSLGEQIRRVEEVLNSTARRLEIMERIVAAGRIEGVSGLASPRAVDGPGDMCVD